MIITNKLQLRKKFRIAYTRYNLFRFRLYRYFFGFEVANQFVQRIDKNSLQLILKNYGASIGKDCDIETGLTFHNCKDYSNLIIGNNCHVGKNCFFDLREKIIIGRNVVISMQTSFITHIDMTKSNLSRYYPARSERIIIGNDCYIGANSTILMGVVLGKSSFVAAKSLIIRNVNPFTLVGGVPGKEMKKLYGTKKAY